MEESPILNHQTNDLKSKISQLPEQKEGATLSKTKNISYHLQGDIKVCESDDNTETNLSETLKAENEPIFECMAFRTAWLSSEPGGSPLFVE